MIWIIETYRKTKVEVIEIKIKFYISTQLSYFSVNYEPKIPPPLESSGGGIFPTGLMVHSNIIAHGIDLFMCRRFHPRCYVTSVMPYQSVALLGLGL